MKTLKKALTIAALLGLCAISLPSLAMADDCTVIVNGKTFKMYGKVQIVDSFPDVKVQIVDAFPELKVKLVDAFPDSCGKVQIVDSFPDVKVQIVDSFPDLKVQLVDAFPGKR